MNPRSTIADKRLEQTLQTDGFEQTFALGRSLAARLAPGTVLLLYGDLGSGKTAFTQGVARGLAVPSSFAVTSPTYTLINEYPGRMPLYHVDLYRLPTPVDPEEIGLLELFEANGVTVVEWAQRLHANDRPSERIDLHFAVTGDHTRAIRLIAYGLDLCDLLKDIDVSSPP